MRRARGLTTTPTSCRSPPPSSSAIYLRRAPSRLATGLPPVGPAFETFDVPLDAVTSQNEDLGCGGVAVRYNFPVDGEYLFRSADQLARLRYGYGATTGPCERRFTVGGGTTSRPAPTTFTIAEPGAPEWEAYVLHADEQLEVRLPVTAGPRNVSVSFVRKMWEPEGGGIERSSQ